MSLTVESLASNLSDAITFSLQMQMLRQKIIFFGQSHTALIHAYRDVNRSIII